MIYKENTKEIALRKITPIIKIDNTYKQLNTKFINNNVKDIKFTNKINNKNTWRLESQRDYSNFDFSKLYANNFQKKLTFSMKKCISNFYNNIPIQ